MVEYWLLKSACIVSRNSMANANLASTAVKRFHERADHPAVKAGVLLQKGLDPEIREIGLAERCFAVNSIDFACAPMLAVQRPELHENPPRGAHVGAAIFDVFGRDRPFVIGLAFCFVADL